MRNDVPTRLARRASKEQGRRSTFAWAHLQAEIGQKNQPAASSEWTSALADPQTTRNRGEKMRSLVCNRPGAVAIEDRPRPQPGEGEVVGSNPSRRRLRHRSSYFPGFAPVPGISAGHRARIVRRSGGQGSWMHHPDRPAGLHHSLSGLRRLCRMPPRQDELLPARSPYWACTSTEAWPDYVCVPEANVARADGVTLDQAAMVEFLAIGAHAIRRAKPRMATAFWSSGRDRSGSAACCSQACKAAR